LSKAELREQAEAALLAWRSGQTSKNKYQQEASMQRLETLFGISPDDGSGATELLYAAVAATAVTLLIFRRRMLARLRVQKD
jgi:hypothetical protein